MDTNDSVFYPSIFNDVLAPVTQGPSSSNTVGPFRIGKIARSILDGTPKNLKIEMSTKGGFYLTFYGMDSDKAFLAGILGKDLLEVDLSKIYDTAKAEGLSYEFEFRDDIPKEPSEMGILTLSSDNETITLTGVTLGGGEIVISDINGKPTEIKGMASEEIMIFGSDMPRKVPCVYPLERANDSKPVFSNAKEMLSYCRDNDKTVWEAAIDYEASITGLKNDDVWNKAVETLDITYKSIEEGYKEGVKFDGVTVAKASAMKQMLKDKKLIPTGVSDMGGLDALAIMEYSNAHGIIVCMPTGGASGIIPAAIKNTSKELGKTKDDEVKALLTAGLIGAFYFPTHYHGALGCQAEVGIATSMAAAGLATMLTDDVKICEKAAVMAMQYIIGQVCDPIEGYPQIPCFIRNIASVPVAATCANMAVLGLDTAIDLDEMVLATLRVGKKILETRISDLGCYACKFCANEKSTYFNKQKGD